MSVQAGGVLRQQGRLGAENAKESTALRHNQAMFRTATAILDVAVISSSHHPGSIRILNSYT